MNTRRVLAEAFSGRRPLFRCTDSNLSSRAGNCVAGLQRSYQPEHCSTLPLLLHLFPLPHSPPPSSWPVWHDIRMVVSSGDIKKDMRILIGGSPETTNVTRNRHRSRLRISTDRTPPSPSLPSSAFWPRAVLSSSKARNAASAHCCPK